MKRIELERLHGVMLNRVAVPPRRTNSPIDRRSIVLGLDNEWDPATREFLSFQIATMVGGQVVSAGFDPRGPLTPLQLIEATRWLHHANGLWLPNHRDAVWLCFVCHNVAADLSVFQDALRDLRIQRMGRGHLAEARLTDSTGARFVVTLFDLYSFLAVPLKVIGDAIGLPKLALDVHSLKRLKTENPDLFWSYGRRDAEIAVLALTQLRDRILRRWRIDILNFATPASVGGEILKRNYFRTPAAPYREFREQINRRRRDGNWGIAYRTVCVFDGDLALRDLAVRCCHGGRSEVFTRGFYPNPVHECDVRSMYPVAALGTALPNHRTPWETVTAVDQLETREGFAQVRFRFPPGTERPCLPIRLTETKDTILYPLTGESYTTFAELRLAVRQGAQMEFVRAYGFTPTASEVDHEIGRYLEALLVEKERAARGSLDRQFYKDLMNQPLGKLGQKSRGSAILEIEHEARARGHAGSASYLAANPDLRESLRVAPDVGSLWMPEQYGLILGKARALISEIAIASNAHSISTDSVIIDANASLECRALREIRALGSDMPIEVAADAVFLGRARQYALLTRVDRVEAGAKVVARDGTWAITKAARQASQESAEQFAQTVLSCLSAGANVAQPREITYDLKPEAAARKAKNVGERQVKTVKTSFNWDKKRILLEPRTNIFTGFTGTRPYESKNRLLGAEQASLVRSGQARRRTCPITDEKRRRVAELAGLGRSIRAIARELSIAPSSVSSILRDAACPTHGDAGRSGG
jgi:hypothetical protein